MSFFDDLGTYVDEFSGQLEELVELGDKVETVRNQFRSQDSAEQLQEDIYTPSFTSQPMPDEPFDPFVQTRVNEPQNQATAIAREQSQVFGIDNKTLMMGGLLLLVALAVR